MVRTKKLLIGGVCLLIVLVSATSGFVVYKKSQENTLPSEVRGQITGFQPYYLPKKYTLPNDFEIDKESVRYEQNTLFFSLKSPSGQIVTISQQAVPQEFSAAGGSFIGKDSIDTKNGKVTISYIDERTSAFLITKDQKTLIILNSNQAIETDIIRGIISSLDVI